VTAIFEHLIATQDGFARLKRPNFVCRYGSDNTEQVGVNLLSLYRSPALNGFFKERHIDLLEISLHK